MGFKLKVITEQTIPNTVTSFCGYWTAQWIANGRMLKLLFNLKAVWWLTGNIPVQFGGFASETDICTSTACHLLLQLKERLIAESKSEISFPLWKCSLHVKLAERKRETYFISTCSVSSATQSAFLCT